MRAVAALLVIPDSDKNPQLNEFVLHIRSSPDLQVKKSHTKFPALCLNLAIFRPSLTPSRKMGLDIMEM